MLQSLGDSQSGGSGELAGLVGGITPAQDLGNGLQAELLDLGLGDQDNSGGTVVEGEELGAVTVPVPGMKAGFMARSLSGLS